MQRKLPHLRGLVVKLAYHVSLSRRRSPVRIRSGPPRYYLLIPLQKWYYFFMSISVFELGRERTTFTDLEVFSVGKNPPRNEDLVGSNETTIVLSDGATDKTGQDFDGHTGGELAAQVVVETSLNSELYGEALAYEVGDALRALYEKINPSALSDSAYRFAATMVVAQLRDDQLIITQVGDSSFRINGRDVYTNNRSIDTLTANARKEYIEATGDIAGSRDFIMPLLKAQHVHQNNNDSTLGFGVIDGSPVPAKFIKTYTFEHRDVTTLEIVSDGYYGAFPSEVSIDAYEALRETIEETDPNKCGEFASTKLNDDRTVIIARLTQA